MGQFVPCPGGQGIARVIDLRVAFSFAHIPVAALEQFDGGPGAQIGAADANHYKNIGIFPDLFRGGLNAPDLLRVSPFRQIQPA